MAAKQTEYTKAKVILMTKPNVTDALITKWATLATMTEDVEFQARITELVVLLKRKPTFHRRYGYDVYHSNPIPFRDGFIVDIKTWLNWYHQLTNEVEAYVDAVIASGKPAWQVSAEKYGWINPKA